MIVDGLLQGDQRYGSHAWPVRANILTLAEVREGREDDGRLDPATRDEDVREAGGAGLSGRHRLGLLRHGRVELALGHGDAAAGRDVDLAAEQARGQIHQQVRRPSRVIEERVQLDDVERADDTRIVVAELAGQ